MRNTLSRTAAFLAASMAIAVSQSFAGPIEQRDGWVTVSTPHSFRTLIKNVRSAVKKEPIAIVTQASASQGAKGQGITIPGNRVMGLYRNDYARRMLKASLAAGIEAPIRLYLTENPDGTSTLSYKTPSAVFRPYFSEGGEELKALATELDGVFNAVVTRAVSSD
ncbi:MAG: DUF302 domain-containing protein [Pseudomonadota bacterium]